jgi:hypothetical protein
MHMSDETKTERCCANCACYWIQENANNPMEKQGFCRLEPPTATQVRVERPRMKNGEAVLDRNNRPIMEPHTAWAYLYKPAMGNLVCFDGWRPLGTEPGEKQIANGAIPESLLSAMKQLYQDMIGQRPAEMPVCIHNREVGNSCPYCPTGVAQWPAIG